MKTLGEAAIDLRWIAPSVASLTTLARGPLPSVWPQLRTDPGLVLLVARALGASAKPADLTDHLDIPILESILSQLQQPSIRHVDWNLPGPDVVYRTCYHQALLASRLAERVGCDVDRAWIAGFLTPLGWLAVTAADPGRSKTDLDDLAKAPNASAWQQRAWGHDHTAIARRLSRAWRLPVWLSAIIGHLGLPANIAERLGAPPKLFHLVQMAVLLQQQREPDLKLPVGGTLGDLAASLQLKVSEAEAIAAQTLQPAAPVTSWEAPATQPLLADLLHMALEQRRQNEAGWIERVQQDMDRLHDALLQQNTNDEERLQAMKLSALAEFAAGAGHEINNPLAVISGQTQYVIKQLDWFNVPADEIVNVGEYLENLRLKIGPSLQKIIGQTQRIHAILTDLMQFARPSASKLQTVSVKELMHDVTQSLTPLARERTVELVCAEPAGELRIEADSAQARAALTSLLRNAIEAAPANGQAAVRAQTDGKQNVELVVEDNGQSPAAAVREHLFDPFFSGRSAGRGRGMGLPTAWRLARQQGGDVRYDGNVQGLTRFVLSLRLAPRMPAHTANGNGNGYHTE